MLSTNYLVCEFQFIVEYTVLSTHIMLSSVHFSSLQFSSVFKFFYVTVQFGRRHSCVQASLLAHGEKTEYSKGGWNLQQRGG